ncbi:MAG: UbiA prenyltransferase family protein [Planctomycetota bacterium]
MDKLFALIESLRPKQWIKNAVVFVGLVFGQRLFDPHAQLRVVLACLSFCCAASGIYLLNDVADRDEDARHPDKRRRPIASGRLPAASAMLGALAAITLALVLAIALSIGAVAPRPAGERPLEWWESQRAFVAYVLAYVGLNVAYSAGLKHVVIADVIAVALGFLIRVVAGTAVIDLPVSSWLILCAFHLATFLALAKRRGELASATSETRPVLVKYDLALLNTLITVAASASLLSYSIYTAAPETVAKFGTRNFIFTVPLAVYGIGRYLFLVYRRNLGEDPTSIVFKDRALQMVIALWVALAVVIIYCAGRTV